MILFINLPVKDKYFKIQNVLKTIRTQRNDDLKQTLS